MANVPFIITNSAITVVLNAVPKVLPASHKNFERLGAELRRATHDYNTIAELADIQVYLDRVTHGEVTVSNGNVLWRDQPVRNIVADRLIEMLRLGHDLAPLANFLGRVMQNPSKVAQDELYLWLESGNQPITPDGYVLAYKKVRNDYRDIYTGTVDHSIGRKPAMPRELVDPDRHRTCSRGLHFCSYGYLDSYGDCYSSRILILRVDPADVVAIPSDYSNQKGRAWTYEVIGEVDHSQPATFFEGRPVVEPYPVLSEGDDPEELKVELEESEDDIEDLVDDPDASTATLDHASDVDALVSDLFTSGPIEPEAALVPVSDAQINAAWKADYEPVPVLTEGTPEKLFTHKGFGGAKSYLASEIVKLISDHGQRGAARLTGVARTTLQEWIKAIRG